MRKIKELNQKDTEDKLGKMYEIERLHILNVLTNKINLMVDDELQKMYNKVMKDFASQSAVVVNNNLGAKSDNQSVDWAAEGAYPGLFPARKDRISSASGEYLGEFSLLYLRRLLSMPLRRLKRRFATAHIRRTTFPFHAVLCSLADSANFRENSNLESQVFFWIWFLPVSRRARLPIITSS